MFTQTNNKSRILIVDDDSLVRNVLCELLRQKYDCSEVGSAEDALEKLQTETFNLVISDIQMTGISGLEMIPKVLELAPDTSIVMISGLHDIESAIKTMRAGAFDYMTKPFDFDHVEAIVKRALEHQSLRLTKKRYENHLEEQIILRTEELQQEILERQLAEEKVNRMAYYDSLTNLPNPTLFRDRFTHELGRSSGNKKLSAVMFLALDRFKNISDTLGHSVGDEILKDFAERLVKCTRKTDTAAYFGGNEFALLANEVDGVEDCAKIVNKIKNVLIPPFNYGGQELHLTASFGISLPPNDGDDCQTLLKNASIALYRARKNGGDNYQFYTSHMHERALKRLSLENSMRRGLEREEFFLQFQPQICASTGKVKGTEALVRWQHPEWGMVSPLDFISIAEETGLIMPLGEWILETACRQNAEWQRSGFPELRIAVNLSLRQFQQKDLIDIISRVLTDSKLEPQFLELELTESLLMNDTEQAIETLHSLRNLGIKISIDDFGCGYSSLSYLKKLPIDVLKIDQAFVRDVTTSQNDAAIVRTIITLANNLHLKTIAEGIETEEQSTVISSMGCDEMQGYLFSKPLSPDALKSFLDAR